MEKDYLAIFVMILQLLLIALKIGLWINNVQLLDQVLFFVTNSQFHIVEPKFNT